MRKAGAIFLLAAAAAGGDYAPAAENVLEALRQNNRTKLRQLVEDPKVDPWRVAHELCVRGEARVRHPAIPLPADETRSVEELVADPAALAAYFPTVETVIIAPPDASGFAVEGTGVLNTPGRYAIICAIPTGADPDEYMAAAAEAEGGPPQVDGGPPHFAKGMWGEITVDG